MAIYYSKKHKRRINTSVRIREGEFWVDRIGRVVRIAGTSRATLLFPAPYDTPRDHMPDYLGTLKGGQLRCWYYADGIADAPFTDEWDLIRRKED